jgi:tetraprenyl-beta-curcumene synthase
VSAFGDRRLLTRAGLALAIANARFWPSVAPKVGKQLKRWETHANTIKDTALRTLALQKLNEERFNAEVAATLATLAPRKHRQAVIEAIVAYEVMFDYLDGLTEQPTADPLCDGHNLYRAFTDAITLDAEPAHDYYRSRPATDDGYLDELVDVARNALTGLPSAATIAHTARRAAQRCTEAQTRAHAVSSLGVGQLERWAAREARDTPLQWQEFLAGAASSVLSVHALIATAADKRVTLKQASTIDTVYLSIAVLSTMLDSLIDHEHDILAGQVGYIRYYPDRDVLARDLGGAARRVVQCASSLPKGAHHVMTLVGVAAYYISAPTANSDFARPVTRRVRRELRPLVTPTIWVMCAWRAAKRARRTL